MTTYQHRDPRSLKSHPLNRKIFNDKPDTEFVASVATVGVIQPPIIAPDGTLIAGERRKQAAIECGLAEIPVIVWDKLKTQHDIDAAWYDSNLHREMTTEQRARWFQARKEFFAVELKENQSAAGKGVANLPQAKGKARDKASDETGMKPRTAEKAAKVTAAIDEAEAAGDTETAADLRETLNGKSVSAAAAKVAANATPKDEGSSASIVLDALDLPVPAALREHHQLSITLAKLGREVDKYRKAAKELAEKPGGEWLRLQDIDAAVRALKGHIQDAAYHTACPSCDGAKRKNCQKCKGNGYLPGYMKQMVTT